MKRLDRLLTALALTLAGVSATQAATEIAVHKSPTCGCCEAYVNHLRENGIPVKTVNESDMDAIKNKYGMSHMASCHAALVNSYVIEGHVSINAIRKLLKEKPPIIDTAYPACRRIHRDGRNEEGNIDHLCSA